MWYVYFIPVNICKPLPLQAGTPLFQQYKRCNWEIEGEVEEEIEGEHNRSLETPRPRKRFYDKVRQ